MVGVVGAVGASPPAAGDGPPALPLELGAAALVPARGLLLLPLFALPPLAPELLPAVLGLVPVDCAPPVAGAFVPEAVGSVVVAPLFALASSPSVDEPQASPVLDSAASRAICVDLIISVTSSSSTHRGSTGLGAARATSRTVSIFDAHSSSCDTITMPSWG
jgi:hypothetical protein